MRHRFVLVVAALAVAGGAALAVTNPLANPGFEEGDLTGWSRAGTASAYQYLSGGNWRMNPEEGGWFGAVTSGRAGAYQELWQTVELNRGDTLSGYAFFATTDYYPYNDDGQVLVLSGDEDGSVAYTALSESVGTVGDYGSTGGWRTWSYEAPATGTYTLLARVRNYLDNAAPSYVGLDGVEFEPGVIEVTLDIKPGSDENPIQLKSKGLIPCAILGTADFDVADVDVATLAFGPGGATEAHDKGHYEDVNQDGYTDLVLHFETQACGISADDTSATVTGQTTDGMDLVGTDFIAPK